MAILAILLILFVLALQLGLVWWGALIVAIGLPVICLVGSYTLAHLIFSDRSILRFESVKQLLQWTDCEDCTAGSQWWDGENWGPIPPHARRMTAGGTHIEPSQANIRKCNKCVGGGWWRSRK